MNISDFLNHLAKFISPESDFDIFINSILIAIAVILFVIFAIIFKKVRIRYILFSIIIGIFYYMAFIWIIPSINSFQTAKVGIIISRFSGSLLEEHLGDKRFNEVLETNLRHILALRRLDTLVLVKATSMKATNKDEAQKIKDRYNADIVIWGEIIKLKDNANLLIFVNPGNMSFVCARPDKELMEISVNMKYSENYDISFSDTIYNIQQILDTIIDVSLIDIAAEISSFDLYTCEEILLSIPLLSEKLKNRASEPFILQQVAFASARRGDTIKALTLYSNSFKKFERLYVGYQNRNELTPQLDKGLRRFAAVSLFQEAHHALSTSDTMHSTICYFLAAKTDSSFIPFSDFEIHEITGLSISDISFTVPVSPFWK